MNRNSPRTLRRIAALVGLASLGLAGCNIVAPALYLAHGPEKTPKLYTLDKKKPTVVFIDDRANTIPRRALRITMAEEFEKTVMRQDVVSDVISSQSAMVAASQDRQGKPIPITEIGQAVKADVVVYATVDRFTLTPDGQTFSPHCVLRVKVIDVANDKRLWPADPHGHPVQVRPNVKTGELPNNTSARYQAEDELARQAGLEIARLFFTHEKPRSVQNPQ